MTIMREDDEYVYWSSDGNVAHIGKSKRAGIPHYLKYWDLRITFVGCVNFKDLIFYDITGYKFCFEKPSPEDWCFSDLRQGLFDLKLINKNQ